MKAKRILTLALAALMVFSLTACVKKNNTTQPGDTAGMEVTADPSTPEGTVKIVFDAFKMCIRDRRCPWHCHCSRPKTQGS